MEVDHTPELGELGLLLKAARKTKGLSQRALSQRAGIPQSHVSKIEAGQVNLQVTSLMQIARALGLEMMLVPQKVIPAVEAITHSQTPSPSGTRSHTAESPVVSEAREALRKVAKDVERISRALGSLPELDRLAATARDLQRLPLTPNLADQVRDRLKDILPTQTQLKTAMKTHQDVVDLLKAPALADALKAASLAAENLRQIRNALAHGAAPASIQSMPAYRLTDGDVDA